VTYPELNEKELALIAPLSKDGKPDLYNYLPTRFVPMDEAKTRGWKWFYVGDVCSHGHKAPRYVSNPRFCVDCRRVKDNLAAIGGKGVAEYTNRPRPYSERSTGSSASPVVVPPRPLEPSDQEKRFLVAYARTKDFDAAAHDVGTDGAVFRARLSYSQVFREAVNALEGQLGMSHTLRLEENFDWDDEKRAILIRVFIDTGDLGLARDAIQVSNYHFQLEVQNNGEFAATLADAEPLANRILDEHAIRKAKNGDSRLLDRVLTAKLPEYAQKLKMDVNVTEKLTDDQLNARFGQVLKQLIALGGEKHLLPRAVDAEFSELGPADEAQDAGDDSGESSAPVAASNLDLL
jgi:hypothetical protein